MAREEGAEGENLVIPELEHARLPPYEHQLMGIERLVAKPFFFLADEMGVGKTKQVIDAAMVLWMRGLIDRAIVIAPAAVRGVWYEPEFGELSKHLWSSVSAEILEYHQRLRGWMWGPETDKRLQWIITNYEFIGRSSQRLATLMPYATARTLLVLDESSAVKGHKSKQTAACVQLRAKCGRVVLLNGTPIENSVGDLFSQANLMSQNILVCKSYTQFCLRYAIMKPVLSQSGRPLTSPRGFPIRTVGSWVNIPDLQKRLAPYVLRRLKTDCLKDLPAKLPSVVMTVPLTTETWTVYKKMRDEMMVWLSDSSMSTSPQVITKIMRLAQITNGFVGGVEDIDLVQQDAMIPGVTHDIDGESWEQAADAIVIPQKDYRVQEVGREKLDHFLGWLTDRLEEEPNFKLLVWCTFRPELLRAIAELKTFRNGTIHVGGIYGGQPEEEREAAKRLLSPDTAPSGPVVVVGNPAAGGRGLTLVATHTVLYMSNSYRYGTRLQSEDRVHRPGQTQPVSYFDLIATGPKGQKTIDHKVLATLMAKESLADMTTSAWRELLMDE